MLFVAAGDYYQLRDAEPDGRAAGVGARPTYARTHRTGGDPASVYR